MTEKRYLSDRGRSIESVLDRDLRRSHSMLIDKKHRKITLLTGESSYRRRIDVDRRFVQQCQRTIDDEVLKRNTKSLKKRMNGERERERNVWPDNSFGREAIHWRISADLCPRYVTRRSLDVEQEWQAEKYSHSDSEDELGWSSELHWAVRSIPTESRRDE